MESRASGSNSGAITTNTCKSAARKSDSALKGTDPRPVEQVQYVCLQREEPPRRAQHRRLQKQTAVHSSEEGAAQQAATAESPGARGPGARLGARPSVSPNTQRAGVGMRLGAVGVLSHTQGAEQDGVCGQPGSPLGENCPAQSQGHSYHSHSDRGATPGGCRLSQAPSRSGMGKGTNGTAALVPGGGRGSGWAPGDDPRSLDSCGSGLEGELSTGVWGPGDRKAPPQHCSWAGDWWQGRGGGTPWCSIPRGGAAAGITRRSEPSTLGKHESTPTQ